MFNKVTAILDKINFIPTMLKKLDLYDDSEDSAFDEYEEESLIYEHQPELPLSVFMPVMLGIISIGILFMMGMYF